MFFSLASKSLVYRKGSVILTILAMTVSIFVMLGVDHIKHQAKTSFASSVSGVDLIIGTRTGSLNLLMYSVFRVGAPTTNISWQSYQRISKDKSVKWAFPISLGDSHKGYRVLGTTVDYFEHFTYGGKQPLVVADGKPFADVFEVVLGSKVASTLGYRIGDKIVLSHGIGSTSFSKHDDAPFKVVGILKATGTPVDQSVHVSIQGLEAVHLGRRLTQEVAKQYTLDSGQLVPRSVTAMMVGLKSRARVFSLQRKINADKREPLSAILPGVALAELWNSMLVVENTLQLISAFVLVSALLGLSAMLLTSIRERRDEIRLLRMIGASPLFLCWLIEVEAILITLLSVLLGIALLYLGLQFAKDFVLDNFGVLIDPDVFTNLNWYTLTIVFAFTLIAALPPALKAFYNAKK